jgi:hypothetical protein
MDFQKQSNVISHSLLLPNNRHQRVKKVSFNEDNLKQKANHNFNEEKLLVMQSSQTIRNPNNEDILSGRGSGINNHPGNIFFRQIVQDNRPQYIKSSPGDKKLIIKEIVDIAASHGRFLKQDTVTLLWSQISYDDAKKKTGQALREAPSSINNKQERHGISKKRTLSELTLHSDASTSAICSPHAIIQMEYLTPSLTSPSSPTNHMRKNNGDLESQLVPLLLLDDAIALSSRMNSLQKKQDELKQLQQEMEDEQYQLVQQLYHMTANITLNSSPFSIESSNMMSSNCIPTTNYARIPTKKRRIMTP